MSFVEKGIGFSIQVEENIIFHWEKYNIEAIRYDHESNQPKTLLQY